MGTTLGIRTRGITTGGTASVETIPPITWDNTTNVTTAAQGSQVYASGGADNDWSVRNPYSTQIGTDNIWSVTVKFLSEYIYFGCTDVADVDANPFFMEFAAYRTTDNGQIVAYENNTAVATLAQYPTDDLTGEVTIESSGSVVKYYYNGVLKHTSASSPIAMKLKVGMYRSNSLGFIITALQP